MSDVIRHIPPCSSCDLEGLESWLTDLAREGHYLKEIGRRSWHFTKGTPAEVSYRLVPGRETPTLGAFFGRHTELLPEDLPQVLRDRYRDQGWVYVTRQRHCYIFRAAEPFEGPIRTEPRIRPEDISRMIQWEWRDLPFWLLMVFVAAPLFFYAISGWGTPLLALNDFLWGYVLILAAGFALVAERAIHLYHLVRLRRKLEHGERFDHGKNWKAWALRIRTARVILVILAVAWTLGSGFLPIFRGEDYNLLEDYPGDPPFPGLEDLITHGTLTGQGGMYCQETGLLIPLYLQWWDSCVVSYEGGQETTFYYNMDYYEARTPAMARRLVEELQTRDEQDRGFRAEEFSVPGLDYVSGYEGRAVLYIQEGVSVYEVILSQESRGLHEEIVPYEVWTDVLTQELKEHLS